MADCARKIAYGDGCYGVAFNEKSKIIFTSNGEGTLTVIQENSANNFSVLGNYPTKCGARTITIDEKTVALFLPTAEFETPAPQTGRPKMLPGSFQVLVVEQ